MRMGIDRTSVIRDGRAVPGLRERRRAANIAHGTDVAGERRRRLMIGGISAAVLAALAAAEIYFVHAQALDAESAAVRAEMQRELLDDSGELRINEDNGILNLPEFSNDRSNFAASSAFDSEPSDGGDNDDDPAQEYSAQGGAITNR